jgi:hypothetical protein
MKPDGYFVVRSPTVNVWSAHRALDPDLVKAKATAGAFRSVLGDGAGLAVNRVK